MFLHPSPGAAMAVLDPAHDLIGASDTELRSAWALLDRRILASLANDWSAVRSGTHLGYDVLARSRLHVLCIGVEDDGNARIIVDFHPDLEPGLRARIPSSPESTGALIFERLARFMPVTVLTGTGPHFDAGEAA